MKLNYYFRRGADSLRRHGVRTTSKAVGQFFRFWINRWRYGRKDLRSMQMELMNLPERLTVNDVYSVACTLGSGVITPMQDRREFIGLLSHVFGGNTVNNILEIGTCGGGSLFCFCRLASPDALIISVDLPGGFFGGGSPSWKQQLFKKFVVPGQKIHLLRMNSHDQNTYQHVVKLLNGKKLDFLFIDGDHTFEGVKQDFEMYSPLVRMGGYIGFHDTLNDSPAEAKEFGYKIGVGKYWRSIRDQYRHLDFEQSGRIGIGLLEMSGENCDAFGRKL